MWEKQSKLQFMKEGVGFFVYKNEGYSFELETSLLGRRNEKETNLRRLNKINLSISSLIRDSKIVDYEIYGKKLYLIREDGLFYVWNFMNMTDKKDCYEATIQTNFKSVSNEHLEQFYKQLNGS